MAEPINSDSVVALARVATDTASVALPALPFAFLSSAPVQAVLVTLATAIISACARFVTTFFLHRARRRRIIRKSKCTTPALSLN